jgi:arsenate reductase
MYTRLQNTIDQLIQHFNLIPQKRKELLQEVAEYIGNELRHGKTVKLNFICTHNSRRSHLAQVWTQTAAAHYEIDGIQTFSGGTEATAFNPRAVAAVERSGFNVKNPGGDNPKLEVKYAENSDPMICFSKTFDDEVNPEKHFAAIMTCSDADENCPFVPGASFRKAVTYRDPKESDDTDHEKETYDERCLQIGREMFYMMSHVQK